MDLNKFVSSAKTKIKNKDYKGALSELESILMFTGFQFKTQILNFI